jgi:NAD(P)-dependent dehydrogenase (short-subunit alcohol dehydrogenase family)
MSLFDLSGKVAVITGSSRGIGRAIAEAFAAEGARVAILDRDAASAAAASIGHQALGLAADVTDADAVSVAFAHAADAFGRLDFLVNNAGVRHMAPIVNEDVEAWRRTLDVNLTGAFNCIRAAVPHMLRGGGGRIVNVASVAGILAFKNRAPYNVSKAGIIALTKSVAQELAEQGIACNAIAPGVIETPLTRDYFTDEEMAAKIRANTPVGHWGQPDDLVGPVVFLCSDAAAFVHGETLAVDGGWVSGKGY